MNRVSYFDPCPGLAVEAVLGSEEGDQFDPGRSS
jgi:hypothetical protein